MQEVTTKIQEQGGLHLFQVSLLHFELVFQFVFKLVFYICFNSCNWHDLTLYLLEDTSENIPIEFESGHKEVRITEVNHYINLLFEKTKLAKLKDDIVSESKTEIKTVIDAKFDKVELTKHQDGSNKDHVLKKQLNLLRQDCFGK